MDSPSSLSRGGGVLRVGYPGLSRKIKPSQATSSGAATPERLLYVPHKCASSDYYHHTAAADKGASYLAHS